MDCSLDVSVIRHEPDAAVHAVDAAPGCSDKALSKSCHISLLHNFSLFGEPFKDELDDLGNSNESRAKSNGTHVS